jgi:AraC-like DNA-binding protein
MRRAGTLEDYLARWHDSHVVERTFCAFHARPGTFGVVVWGRPTADDALAIVRARAAELRDDGRHELALDYRLVEVIDHDAFRCLADWVGTHREALGRVTSRVALIKPVDPFAGATVAGFYNVVESPYPSRLCATLDEAATWLAPASIAAVARIHELAGAGRPITRALVGVLDRDLTLGIDAAARELGLSARTLQRRLQDETTTFLAEARRARVRRAKELLAGTDDKIAAIAQAVGCTTAQHFTEMFRAETGVPPAAWRAQTRRG